MEIIRQNVVVSSEGVKKTDRGNFHVDSLGEPLAVVMRYELDEAERHVTHGHGRIQLTDTPIVFGGSLISTTYNPFENESTFTIETNEFQPEYKLRVQQPLTVWLHSPTVVVAETQINIKGPERQPKKLGVMPTAVVDREHRSGGKSLAGPQLMWAPDSTKQEFQLLVDPFGGQIVKKTATVSVSFADEREIGQLLIIPHVANRPGSGRILDDGTGAVFVVQGLQSQRNYKIQLDVDGTLTFNWQATTKTGPFFDDLRS